MLRDLMILHWGQVDISIDSGRPASGGVLAIQGQGITARASGTGQSSRISSSGGVGNVRGRGKNKRSGGSGGTCG